METQIQSTVSTNEELKEFFTIHLKTLYWAEKKLVDTLPDLYDAAGTPQLKSAFREHLAETKQHVLRLEQVFSIIGEDADDKKCKIMDSIADAGSDVINDTEDGSSLRDIGLIFGGQMAEHYEIASYGNMIELANQLGYSEAANLMTETLVEEKKADELLSKVAKENVNRNPASFLT